MLLNSQCAVNMYDFIIHDKLTFLNNFWLHFQSMYYLIIIIYIVFDIYFPRLFEK